MQMPFAYALARQPDGKLVIVGMSSLPRRDFLVMRLRRNGALDRGFGRGGVAVVSFGDHPDSADAVALRADGSILVGGHTTLPDEAARPWCVAHCNALRFASLRRDGTPDTRFGSHGTVATDVEVVDGEMALEPDGRGGFIVGTSTYASGLDAQTTALRIDRNGRARARSCT